MLRFFKDVCRFRKTTVSAFFICVFSTLILMHVYDTTRYRYTLPEHNTYESYILDTVWNDLQKITEYPHPYTSHANRDVHDYLLNRVQKITEGCPFIEVSDDQTNGVSKLFRHENVFNSSSEDVKIVYLESSNILVKIEGRNSTLPGLLLSAHYDSVPMSYGATDDGKGVVSLIGLLMYFSQNQPERTLIFNFNNNEEFGLLGAVAFFQHKWSSLVSFVINLEGTGAGGKAILFRTSSIATASIYKIAVKQQPFGNSIYQQGFYNRYVSSETDYKIYEQRGLYGWDIAFYKPRNLYHTRKDSIVYTDKSSLWHMLHTTWQLSKYIAMNDVQMEDTTPAIYFDIIGKWFFAFSANTLYKFNCSALVIIPLLMLVLRLFTPKKKIWNINDWCAFWRLPASISIAFLTIFAFQMVLLKRNPLIFSRDFLSPTFAFITQFALVNYLLLSYCEYVWPVNDFKTLSLLQIFVVTWIILIHVTVKLYNSDLKNTGIYVFSICYALISTSAICGLLYMLCDKARNTSNKFDIKDEIHSLQVPIAEIEPSEQSPLLYNSQESNLQIFGTAHKISVETPESLSNTMFNYEWSIQFAILVPLATYFIWNSSFLILDALAQTVQESLKSNQDVAKISMIGGAMMIIPLIPFIYKLNYIIVIISLLVCIITSFSSLTNSPFTENSPLKLRVIQEIDLNNGSIPIVNIFGRKGNLIKPMICDLPSIKESKKEVTCVPVSNGTEMCQYIGELPYLLDENNNISPDDILNLEILSNSREYPGRSSYEPLFAIIRINALNNRVCKLTFDYGSNSSPIRTITVFNGNYTGMLDKLQIAGMQGYFKDNDGNENFRSDIGINELLLHKLDFSLNYYQIGIQWLPRELLEDGDNYDNDDSKLGIDISCFWGEVDGQALVNGKLKNRNPSLHELIQYSPKNFIFSNKDRGMVSIKKYIEL